eukprot:CFRG2430T1
MRNCDAQPNLHESFDKWNPLNLGYGTHINTYKRYGIYETYKKSFVVVKMSFLKNAWRTQPVIFMSFVFSIAGIGAFYLGPINGKKRYDYSVPLSYPIPKKPE